MKAKPKTEAEGRCRKARASEIFLDMIIASTPERCTIWPYGKTCGGYGAVTLDGRHCSTHAASWEIYHNCKVPSGYFVCHSCDVKACFNPFHLFLGTPKDNMDDMVRKSRQSRGSRHGMARLNESNVVKIRLLHLSLSTKEIAEQFGVTCSTVSKVIRGVAWKHV